MNSLRYDAIGAPSRGHLRMVVRPLFGGNFYKQLLKTPNIRSFSSNSLRSTSLIYPTALRSRFLPNKFRTSLRSLPSSRSLHYTTRLGKDSKTEPVKEESGQEEPANKTTAEEPKSGQEKAKDETKGESKQDGEQKEGGEKEGEEKEGGGKEGGEKKEAPPPPPPHGDKSPWQVFTDTLQSEFKASKEWNESTKALAAGAQQFTENESVRRARQAYESTTGAVSSTTANVLKTTAGAVGKGAAWTWETPVVKGVRTTVNATANVIEKGTRPIRETEAYKNVKDVIDDGSSSRYGGWVEKEERRKARELRELQQAQGGTGKPTEVAKEDPE
jgi:import inner membrane translocase subunit TIM44